MKRYIKYLMVTVLIFVFSACNEEFLEFVPEDKPTLGSWYQNEEQIRSSTSVLYGSPWFAFNDVFAWAAGELLAGDVYHDWDEEGQFMFFSYNNNNRHIGDGWESLYNVVSSANLIINDMPTIAEGFGVSEGTINAGLAEARFMRASAYYFLVEYWEEVPIIENPSADIVNGNISPPKHTTASVYEFIRRDLVFAAENLPNSDVEGRVTSWSAKGMLAKLHVTLGQRSQGGNTAVGSAADFQIAEDYAAEVINNSGLALYSDYEQMFRPENEQNSEILFALEWIVGGYGVGSSRQARFARSAIITSGGNAWGSGKCVTQSFMDNHAAVADGNANNDLRRKAIYMQVGDVYPYMPTGPDPDGYEYFILARDDAGDQSEGPTPLINNLKKHVIGSASYYGITNQDSPMNSFVLRLADVYLLYAEALMGSGDNLSGGEGLVAYNAVRTRAGLASRGSINYEDIFNERRVELGLDGLAWLEVKRRYYRDPVGTLTYLQNQSRNSTYFRIDNDDALENDPAGYELLAPGESGTGENINEQAPINIIEDNMVLPIPSAEVTANENLGEDEAAEEYVFE